MTPVISCEQRAESLAKRQRTGAQNDNLQHLLLKGDLSIQRNESTTNSLFEIDKRKDNHQKVSQTTARVNATTTLIVTNKASSTTTTTTATIVIVVEWARREVQGGEGEFLIPSNF